jgi:hypothetical protein
MILAARMMEVEVEVNQTLPTAAAVLIHNDDASMDHMHNGVPSVGLLVVGPEIKGRANKIREQDTHAVTEYRV